MKASVDLSKLSDRCIKSEFFFHWIIRFSLDPQQT